MNKRFEFNVPKGLEEKFKSAQQDFKNSLNEMQDREREFELMEVGLKAKPELLSFYMELRKIFDQKNGEMKIFKMLFDAIPNPPEENKIDLTLEEN